MAMVYATLIIKGAYTFDKVPVNQQEKVKQILADCDLDTEGKPLAETV